MGWLVSLVYGIDLTPDFIFEPTPQVIGKNHTNKDYMVFLLVRVYWRQYRNNATVEGVHPLFRIKKYKLKFYEFTPP
jgi:hypothetical protein